MMVLDEKTRLSNDMIRRALVQDVFTKWQLESADIIEEVTKSLGWTILIVKDKTTGRIITNALPTVDNPQINKAGILTITQNLYPILNKNTFLADIRNTEIDGRFGIMFSHAVATLTDLAENFDFYEIESTSTLTKIQIMIENVCLIALSRGRDGATLEYMKTIQRILEQHVVSDRPAGTGKKRGVWK